MSSFTIIRYFTFLLLLSLSSTAQDAGSKNKTSIINKEGVRPGTEADDTTARALYLKYITPGEMHKMMATWEGKWDAEITAWMDASTPAQNATGKVENKMIMNGLYQLATFSADLMGTPYEGQGTTGFNNLRGLFETTWIDNMSSAILKMEGFWNGSTKTMNLKGRMLDPFTATTKAVRQTLKIVDDNTQIMEMFQTGADGKEFRMMQIKYTRAK
jgi:hypothetical protein